MKKNILPRLLATGCLMGSFSLAHAEMITAVPPLLLPIEAPVLVENTSAEWPEAAVQSSQIPSIVLPAGDPLDLLTDEFLLLRIKSRDLTLQVRSMEHEVQELQKQLGLVQKENQSLLARMEAANTAFATVQWQFWGLLGFLLLSIASFSLVLRRQRLHSYSEIEEVRKESETLPVQEAVAATVPMVATEEKLPAENDLVKSSPALDTLLSLVKTYVGMEEMHAAKGALQEVASYGNSKQKAKAKKLLAELEEA